MVDDNCTDYCAIQQVFGLYFMTSKMGSCQMHNKHDVNKAFFRIGMSFRDEFKNICYEVCTVATVAQYNEQKRWPDETTNLSPHIARWVTRWDARKCHMSPAFR